MAVPSLSDPKAELRREARARRTAFVAANADRNWSPGARDFDRLFDRGVEYASYRPVGSEADPAPIETIAAGRHNMVPNYPRIDPDGAMRFYSPGPDGFVRNAHGIDEPGPGAHPPECGPSVVFTPLLAFDRSGTRLGQGGGHYDRALARLRSWMEARGWVTSFIGVAWSVQEMPSLPRDPWDIPLDAVITEREWIDCTP